MDVVIHLGHLNLFRFSGFSKTLALVSIAVGLASKLLMPFTYSILGISLNHQGLNIDNCLLN